MFKMSATFIDFLKRQITLWIKLEESFSWASENELKKKGSDIFAAEKHGALSINSDNIFPDYQKWLYSIMTFLES